VSRAGGVPLVGLTAWQALMAAQPHQGQRALVLAASGGELLYVLAGRWAKVGHYYGVNQHRGVY